MRERLEALLGAPPARGLTVGTFHATCARMLRATSRQSACDPRFAIYDDGDQMDLMKTGPARAGARREAHVRRAPC